MAAWDTEQNSKSFLFIFLHRPLSRTWSCARAYCLRSCATLIKRCVPHGLDQSDVTESIQAFCTLTTHCSSCATKDFSGVVFFQQHGESYKLASVNQQTFRLAYVTLESAASQPAFFRHGNRVGSCSSICKKLAAHNTSNCILLNKEPSSHLNSFSQQQH